MVQKLSFDAYLGWVNITNPNQIPEDARVIGANDLLRYENFGKQAAKAINEISEIATDAGLAALIDVSGSEFGTRLTNMTAQQITNAVDETDYVSLLAARSRTNRLTVRKSGSGAGGSFEVSAISGEDHITSTFNSIAAGDKYHRIWETWHGSATPNYADATPITHSALTFTGTWYNTEGQADYATGAGATFSAILTLPHSVNAIEFKAYRDNRGGLWNFTLTDSAGAVKSKKESVWASTAAEVRSRLFADIPAGTYTLKGTFAGDDPAHVPSNGTGQARGWIGRKNLINPTAFNYTFMTQSPTSALARDQRIAPVSNWDIALLIRPVGANTYEWVPEHNGINSSVIAEAPKFFNGNKPLDMDALAMNATVEIDDSFEMVQHIYGRHTSAPTVNIIEYWTSHRFYPDGKITVTGKWKALKDIQINQGYVLMLPVEGAVFDKVISSYGNTYNNTPAMYGTRTYLTEEADTATSYVFTSTAKKDLAIAVTYRNSGETMRRGKAGKPTRETVSFLEHQDATKTKLYQQLYANNSNVPAGTVHRFSGDFIRINAPGIYDYLSLS